MVSADGGSTRSPFIGLREGIDINDGSLRSISISDNEHDGLYEVFQHDTYWSLCGDGSGLFNGLATVGSDGDCMPRAT